MSENIRFTVSAEDRFSRVFGALRRDLSSVKDQAVTVGRTLQGALAFGGAASVVGMGAAVRQLVNDLDNLNDSADATGATVENLSALEDVARRNGGSLDLVSAAVVKMNAALKEAKADSPVAIALKAIGLNAAELRKDDPAIAVQKIAQALAGFADDGNKARLVQELFGKSLREVAPFLKDLADAGELNAKVTSEQAQQAEKFNKQLFAMQTNASNAARSLVADLLPTMNEVFTRMEALRGTFGSLGAGLVAGLTGGKAFRDSAEGVTYYTGEVERLKKVVDNLKTGGSVFDKLNLGGREEDLAKARKWLEFYERVAVAQQKFAGGGPDPAAPPAKLPDLTGAGGKSQVTEAQRYLETLQKQVEALEHQSRIGTELEKITASEQLTLDLKARRIDGITVALEKQLRAEAKRLDTARELDKFKEREAAFQKLLGDVNQREVDRGLSLMEQTPTGRRQRMEGDVDSILRVARANPNDPVIQGKASQALQQLRKDLDELDQPAEQAATAWDNLADTIDKGMDRATGALLDFAIEGKGDFADVGKALARDIARGLLEEPIRDQVKVLGKNIADTLKGALNGKDIFGDLIKWLQSLGSGSGGGDWGGIFSAIGAFFGGGTTRALGGPVKAGQMVRWQENGQEWFVPQQDGTVVTEGQLRGRTAASAAPTIHNVFHVNGDVSPQTLAAMEAMIDRNNARLQRSLRLGGAY